MNSTIGKLPLQSSFAFQVPEPDAPGDAKAVSFADLLSSPEDNVPGKGANWSEEGLPVRSHTRRFDETSLLALASAMGVRAGTEAQEAGSDLQVSDGGAIQNAVSMESGGEPIGGEAPDLPLTEQAKSEILRADRSPVLSARSISGLRTTAGRVQGAVDVPSPPNISDHRALAGVRARTATRQVQSAARVGSEPAGAILRDMTPLTGMRQQAVQIAMYALESGLRVLVKVSMADVSDPAELQQAIETVLAEHGYPQAEIHFSGVNNYRQGGGK